MNTKRGILPIFMVLIIVGSLGVAGGSYTGVQYYQSNKYQKMADQKFQEGSYQEAKELYERSLSHWNKKETREKRDKANKEKELKIIINEVQIALYNSNWSICLERLNAIDSSSSWYTDAQRLITECQGWIDKDNARKAEEIAAQDAAKRRAEEKTKASATTTKNVNSDSSSVAAVPTNPPHETQSSPSPTPTQTPAPTTPNTDPSPNSSTAVSCTSNASPIFTHDLTDLNKVNSIAIPPRIVGGHLKTHSYINSEHQRVPVYAPVDMKLKGGVHLSHGSDPDDYGMDFEVSCEVTIRIGHITDPIQSIKDTFPTATVSSATIYDITPISFKAGDLIGYTTGTAAAGNWDYGVYNSSTKNRFADDPSWNNSWVYTTAVCPYDYFSSSLRSSYSSKYVGDFGVSILYGDFFCQ